MFIETQIKTRQSKNTPWCPEVDTEYVRVIRDAYRADGRLINVVHQISEDTLQHTRTMIFRDRDTREAFFADPIVAALEQRTANYDLVNHIQVRTVADDAAKGV